MKTLFGQLAAALAAFVSPVAGVSAADDVIGQVTLPPGFEVELVHRVPMDSQGSWVALTFDPQGRAIVSDQYGKLYRVTPSPLGESPKQTRVESIDLPIGMAQGLLCANDSLYVMVNGGSQQFGSGLYRVTDSNDDDRWDRFEQLRAFQGGGEHGPHAVALGPDGKSLYFSCGNHTATPLYSRSLVPPVWQEDQLLPRILDPRGHAASIRAPGGWVARTDLDGNSLELFCVGFRNTYDIAFNNDGELVTFDADMEWDIGTPWYRPTRICHVVSGVDFGWRSGNGKWRPWYIDSLPAAVDIGPGSPTGITFGYGARFPAKYQQALFAADWSFGRIFAVHLEPQGSTYSGEFEIFATAMPLAVTDMAVRPQDGALYFAVGGRKSASALYRIVYTGEPDAQIQRQGERRADAEAVAARKLRHELESLHGGPQSGAIEKLWPHLASQDVAIRSAARLALEHQPLASWLDRALLEKDARRQIAALAAAARLGTSEHQAPVLDALMHHEFASLPEGDQLDLLRTVTLACIRLGPLSTPERQRLIEYLRPEFPHGRFNVDRELADLLVFLDVPEATEAIVKRMESVEAIEQAIDFAMGLSAMKHGWTNELRRRLLQWFVDASDHGGGASCFGYMIAARDRFVAACPPDAREQLAALIIKPLAAEPVKLESRSRSLVKKWTLAELQSLVANDKGPRDVERGREMFAAASCFQCHRVGPVGSTVGPDLTAVGKRFGTTDLLRAIVQPNDQISDQYQQWVFESGGKTYVGRITNIFNNTVSVSTNILDPKSAVELRREEIDEQYPSKVSMMPGGLLNTLTADEVLDLLAYLRSGGR